MVGSATFRVTTQQGRAMKSNSNGWRNFQHDYMLYLLKRAAEEKTIATPINDRKLAGSLALLRALNEPRFAGMPPQSQRRVWRNP